MNDKKELMTQQGINFRDPETIKTLMATVAQGLSTQEFALFVEHCKSTGLNPFKKEVWAIKAGNRLQIMTGLNGYLAIANRHPEYDGMQVEVDNDEKPSKAICKVFRKDRKYPAEGIALMKEYGKETPIWKQMPRVMLTKVAKSIALREAFPQELNGTYTEEEMPQGYEAPVKQVTGVVMDDEPPAFNPEDEDQREQTEFRYDISKCPENKKASALLLLRRHNAVTEDDLEHYWIADHAIEKLAEYLEGAK